MWSLGLWKILLKEDTQSDGVTFWAYNFDEKAAQKAAMKWSATEYPGKVFAISSIDKQPTP